MALYGSTIIGLIGDLCGGDPCGLQFPMGLNGGEAHQPPLGPIGKRPLHKGYYRVYRACGVYGV